jgi:hypothetical protein
MTGCPHGIQCMKEIAPEKVFQACLAHLAAVEKSP